MTCPEQNRRKQFTGFPARMQFTPIPNIFFSHILPQIDDIDELRASLHVFAILYNKKGNLRFVTLGELLAERGLMSSLDNSGEEALRKALDMATQRGTILHIVLDGDKGLVDVYFLNNEANRQIITRIQNGEPVLSGLRFEKPDIVAMEKPPDIFIDYEQNIGMITPMIADELREAEKLYPAGWIGDAIKEAVTHNKRNWRYIARILENWAAEGKSNGTHQRDSKPDSSDKYRKQPYDHLVQR
ncbi:MAG: DnaD domain protein [Chloroflexi bacterium]|nr:DnaD domain protein [Chloroflexota bacterium]